MLMIKLKSLYLDAERRHKIIYLNADNISAVCLEQGHTTIFTTEDSGTYKVMEPQEEVVRLVEVERQRIVRSNAEIDS